MRVAITGGTGFVGRNLARLLISLGHEVRLISRGVDNRDPDIRSETELHTVGLSDKEALERVFEGCDAVAHLAGINREIGSQTYENVHVRGTENVVAAAEKASVKKILLLSFLRARPNCGSLYHESKWAAEEIVTASNLDYTIFKAGVIYGKGDHMLDHITHALHTFPIFLSVGFKDKSMKPLAVEDLAHVMQVSLTDPRLSRKTVPITGPEQLQLTEAIRRIMKVTGKRRLMLPAPVWFHYAMAWFFERTMITPLAAKAQVRILSEGLTQPLLAPDELSEDLMPKTSFTDHQILKGLPIPERFGMKDCLCRSRRLA